MPYWHNKIDLYDLFADYDDEDPIEPVRDEAVRRFRLLLGKIADAVTARSSFASVVLRLADLVDEMASVDDADEFNVVLAAIYDWGDVEHRLWVNVAGGPLKEGLVV